MKKHLKRIGFLIGQDISTSKRTIFCIIAYFLILKLFFSSVCPLVGLTGFPCPACGLTRAGMALIRLDFAVAWHTNLCIFPIAFLVLYFLFNRYILEKTSKGMQKSAIILLLFMFGYYIYRMIRFFPGEPPISYYHNNVLKSLIDKFCFYL